MEKTFPEKLKVGDVVRVIAPAASFGIISQANRDISERRFKEMGLRITFGEQIEEMDAFNSSSIRSRVEDFHDAFRDPSIKAVFAVIGGFNSNQLLQYIDWDVIRSNPKIFCGYSDITALGNAIYAKTGLVNYSGPGYATFSEKIGFEYTWEYFKKCVLSDKPFDIHPSDQWSDDLWYRNQEKRSFMQNEGMWIINEGEAFGTLLGANLCTFNLLQGTEYFPDLHDSILFLEDDLESQAVNFERDLQSLIHQSGFNGVRGIAIGRFQQASNVTREMLTQIIRTKRELNDIPVIANVDFGHTQSMVTFPIGGDVSLSALSGNVRLTIIKH